MLKNFKISITIQIKLHRNNTMLYHSLGLDKNTENTNSFIYTNFLKPILITYPFICLSLSIIFISDYILNILIAKNFCILSYFYL